MQALSNLKVIDLTHAFAGPFCTHQLRLLGAEVIKVEPPQGDHFRSRPSAFAALNAGKRSLVLDLKQTADREQLIGLIKDADVVIENFRPGVAAKLGLDWPALQAINPRLIYGSISGYGQDGPLSQTPAIEWSVQAASGLAELYLSDADPWQMGLPVLDAFSGYMAFSAIMAALLQRHQTGEGQRLDIAMLDAALVLLSPRVAAVLSGDETDAAGVKRATVARYATGDGVIQIAAVTPQWFEATARIIGAESLLADPRFSTPKAREQNAAELLSAMEGFMAAKSAEAWERDLTAAGIPASKVRTTAEVLAHPQIEARGLLQTVQWANGAQVQIAGAGFALDGGTSAEPAAIPELGEFNARA